MRQAIYVLGMVSVLWGVPAEADTDETDSRDLMERGAQMLLDGLRKQFDPALFDLRDMVENMRPEIQEWISDMGPALVDIIGRIDSASEYGPPELLPNGDIIIRRKKEPVEPEAPVTELPPPDVGETDI